MRELDNREGVLRTLEDLEDLEEGWNFEDSPPVSILSILLARYFITYIDPVYFMDRPMLSPTEAGTLDLYWQDKNSTQYIGFEFMNNSVDCVVRNINEVMNQYTFTIGEQGGNDIHKAQKLLFHYYNEKRPQD